MSELRKAVWTAGISTNIANTSEIKPGNISKKQADTKALAEYDMFRVQQDKEFIGDFEKEAKRLEAKDEW